jgi:hypothetical protein
VCIPVHVRHPYFAVQRRQDAEAGLASSSFMRVPGWLRGGRDNTKSRSPPGANFLRLLGRRIALGIWARNHRFVHDSYPRFSVS